MDAAEPMISPFFPPCILLLFQNLAPTLLTMQHDFSSSDITSGNIKDFMQLPLELQKPPLFPTHAVLL